MSNCWSSKEIVLWIAMTISIDDKQFLLNLKYPRTYRVWYHGLNSMRKYWYNSISNTMSRVALNAGNASTQNILENEVLWCKSSKALCNRAQKWRPTTIQGGKLWF